MIKKVVYCFAVEKTFFFTNDNKTLKIMCIKKMVKYFMIILFIINNMHSPTSIIIVYFQIYCVYKIKE